VITGVVCGTRDHNETIKIMVRYKINNAYVKKLTGSLIKLSHKTKTKIIKDNFKIAQHC